ncbi:MAG: TetR/AcrR family transcriptional regulator, repressor of the mexAB-oprM multidrug resistance operon [Acidimicrobiaceae bacterium]|jgi:AcrR family transcriptional regulator
MPRTRPDLDRDDKVAAIVDGARGRLLDGGYESLSIVALARELGLAQAAIYWYFPTKDHVFVAALDRILHDILSRKPRTGDALTRVLWFADRLHDFQDLRVSMRDRARTSEVVAEYDRDVTALLRVLLVGACADDVQASTLDDTVDAVMALCDGVLLRDLPKARRHQLIRFGYTRLVHP